MDRIAHAGFVEGLEPIRIAARAGVRLATAGLRIDRIQCVSSVVHPDEGNEPFHGLDMQ
jgi:hypothetical protein